MNDGSIMDMRKRYVNIPLPDELAKQIDEIMETIGLGYKTKSEFIKEAVREKIMKLNDFKNIKKQEKTR